MGLGVGVGRGGGKVVEKGGFWRVCDKGRDMVKALYKSEKE